MKYVSRKHLYVLMVMVLVLGAALLTGEYFAWTGSEVSDRTSTPSVVTSTGEQGYFSDRNKPQEPLALQSQSFVIRPGQSRLTYTDALELYKNNILQFDEDCQLTTNSRSFHLNNEIMIDNRSGLANTFSVGDNAITVGAYDFGFMILKDRGAYISVACGNRGTVAGILVQ